jgi:hypothetical protein
MKGRDKKAIVVITVQGENGELLYEWKEPVDYVYSSFLTPLWIKKIVFNVKQYLKLTTK